LALPHPLGFGAQQANAGLEFVFGIPVSSTAQVFLIIGITLVALVSVMRGLDGGVKVLSEINMMIAALLLLFVIIAGPTMTIVSDFFANLGAYAREVVPLSMPFGREDDGFRQGWTAFYWAWWISWSPFVGMFIARVSRGRTVREFVICVLIIPSIVSVLWMTAFGGTAIHQVLTDSGSQVREYVIASYSPALSLFGMLADLPFASIHVVHCHHPGNRLLRDPHRTPDPWSLIRSPPVARWMRLFLNGSSGARSRAWSRLRSYWAAASGPCRPWRSLGLSFTIVLLLACYTIFKGLKDEPR
jgi:BCCT family betaine/carnitine transporter